MAQKSNAFTVHAVGSADLSRLPILILGGRSSVIWLNNQPSPSLELIMLLLL